ncbi:hypothetical protein ACVWXU_008043 [Streptomyces sp. TE33382]
MDLLGLERPGGPGVLPLLVLGGVPCGDGVEGLAHVFPRTLVQWLIGKKHALATG